MIGTLAIMQPTFLPWLGYFAMLDSVETFVFLDSVQFARRSWQQRNRIKTPSGAQWLTVPAISKGQRDQLISEVALDDSQNFRAKLIGSIQANYSKAKFYKDYSPGYFAVIKEPNLSLADLNIRLIELAARDLGITGKRYLRSSELSVGGTKADLLVSICQQLGFRRYLSALGSREYIEESVAFETAGIEVSYNEYIHPVYEQLFGPFEGQMCILDLIFNEGPNALHILRSGKAPRPGVEKLNADVATSKGT